MRALSTLAFVVSLAGLLITVSVLGKQGARVRGLEATVERLRAQLDNTPKTASLELQAKCAEAAKRAYESNIGSFTKNRMFSGQRNHYSVALSKCFVDVRLTDMSGPGTMISHGIYDAFEGRELGSYLWHNPGGKKHYEVAPIECELTLPSGEKKTCTSMEEFETLAKVYLEDP